MTGENNSRAHSQAEDLPRVLCARRALGELTADPHSEFWSGLPCAALRETVSGHPPKQSTRLQLAWDALECRILFTAEDIHPWATLTERDAPLYQEEVVEVFLDPVGDLECYFEIEVNPLNAVLDLVLRRNRSGYVKDFAWRCEGLRTAVARDDTGWRAELSIPFSALTSAPPSNGSRWRANFLRIDRPPGTERELSAWSPTGRANFHLPERFGFVEFGA
jgi:Carbohydrate family 9 binding domain-like